MTSFPVLIIMIIMKKTDHIAAWIVKLPAFRIYILFDHSFVFSSFWLRLIRLLRMFQRRDLIRFQSAFNDHLTYFLLKSSVVVLFFSCILVFRSISSSLPDTWIQWMEPIWSSSWYVNLRVRLQIETKRKILHFDIGSGSWVWRDLSTNLLGKSSPDLVLCNDRDFCP